LSVARAGVHLSVSLGGALLVRQSERLLDRVRPRNVA
jgi:hypothetical protein